jgi:hypothetical protein
MNSVHWQQQALCYGASNGSSKNLAAAEHYVAYWQCHDDCAILAPGIQGCGAAKHSKQCHKPKTKHKISSMLYYTAATGAAPGCIVVVIHVQNY